MYFIVRSDLVLFGVLCHLVEVGSEVAESVVVGSGEMEHQTSQSRHLITLSLSLHHHPQKLLEPVT